MASPAKPPAPRAAAAADAPADADVDPGAHERLSWAAETLEAHRKGDVDRIAAALDRVDDKGRKESSLAIVTTRGGWGGFRYLTWGRAYGGDVDGETLLHLVVRPDASHYPHRYAIAKALVDREVNTTVRSEAGKTARDLNKPLVDSVHPLAKWSNGDVTAWVTSCGIPMRLIHAEKWKTLMVVHRVDGVKLQSLFDRTEFEDWITERLPDLTRLAVPSEDIDEDKKKLTRMLTVLERDQEIGVKVRKNQEAHLRVEKRARKLAAKLAGNKAAEAQAAAAAAAAKIESLKALSELDVAENARDDAEMFLDEDREPPDKTNKPLNEIRGVVIRARRLIAADANLMSKNSSDPYAVVAVTGTKHKHKTKTKSATLEPVWEEDGPDARFAFPVTVAEAADAALSFIVYDYDGVSMDDPLGYASLPAGALADRYACRRWFALSAKDGAADKDRGAIELWLQWRHNPRLAALAD